MAQCKSCGTRYGFLDGGGQGHCAECYVQQVIVKDDGISGQVAAQAVEREAWEAAVNAVMLTTEAYPQGLRIARRIEIVTAECAFGMNIFKDLFAGVRDIVGGRSEAVQKTLRDSRRTALFELKAEAHRVGANAVIAVDLDYVELSGAGNMVLLVASGTAVIVEQE